MQTLSLFDVNEYKYSQFLLTETDRKEYLFTFNLLTEEGLDIDSADIAAVLWIAKLKKERFVHPTKNKKRSAALYSLPLTKNDILMAVGA